MKINDKRIRSDSASEESEILQGLLSSGLRPPGHITLRPTDEPFWVDIISARARETWNQSDLTAAAELARTRGDIESVRKQIAEEGDIIENKRGTQIVNPLHTLLETLTRRAVLLARTIHVHAEATQGRSRDTGERGKKSKEMQAAADVVREEHDEGDGLIAMPSH